MRHEACMRGKQPCFQMCNGRFRLGMEVRQHRQTDRQTDRQRKTQCRFKDTDLASSASGGAYSAVCSSSDGPSVLYKCSMECLSTAEPKSISLTCRSPTDRGSPAAAAAGFIERRSTFSGFKSLHFVECSFELHCNGGALYRQICLCSTARESATACAVSLTAGHIACENSASM